MATREETNPLFLPGKKPRFLGNQQRKLVNIPVDLSRLSSVTKHKVLKPFYDLRDSGFKPLREIKGQLIIYAITVLCEDCDATFRHTRVYISRSFHKPRKWPFHKLQYVFFN